MKKYTCLLLIFLLCTSIVPSSVKAGTYTAATCNYTDVNAVINGPTHTAVDGDVIIIPSGSCTWTGVNLTAPAGVGITLTGAGTPTASASAFVPSMSCASTTTITLQTSTLLVTTPSSASSLVRVSCLTLIAGNAFSVVDLASTAGTNVITSASATFFSGMVGSTLRIYNPGTNFRNNDYFIDGVTNAHTLHVTSDPTNGSNASGGSGYSTHAIGLIVQGTCSSTTCTNARIDNVTYDSTFGNINFGNWVNGTNAAFGFNIIQDCFGVVDHTESTSDGAQLVEVSHGHFLNVGQYGDNSWSTPEYYGQGKDLTFENNTAHNTGFTENEGVYGGQDSEGGSRIVVRFNHLDFGGTSPDPAASIFSVGWHGTENRYRGGRKYEFYGNTLTCKVSTSQCASGGLVSIRSGTGLAFGNTIISQADGQFGSLVHGTTYRIGETQSGPVWIGPCTGATVFDANIGGGTPTVFFSGIITAVTGGTQFATTRITVTDSMGMTPTWTAGQWGTYGTTTIYGVNDITANNGAQVHDSGPNWLEIYNTGNYTWNPSVSDTFNITRATACLDQDFGRGAGYLYTNGFTPEHVAANQALSPTYAWMNSFNHALGVDFLSDSGVYSQSFLPLRNREWYSEDTGQTAQTTAALPFDGSTSGPAGKGIGHGTGVRMPTMCTLNTGYWNESVGSWNSSSNTLADGSSQGVLYVCNNTNNWVSTYTPFNYPHTLITPLPSLSFTGQPSNTASGATMSPAVVVTVSDSTLSGQTMTLTVSGCGTAVTGNTATISTTTATFSSIVPTGLGTACTFTASTLGASPNTSASFNVTGAPPTTSCSNTSLGNHVTCTVSISGASINGGFAATTPSVTSSGNIEVVVANFINFSGTTPCVPSDSKGNVFTPIVTQYGSLNNLSLSMWYVKNPTVGAGHTVTCTSSSITSSYIGVKAMWFSTPNTFNFDKAIAANVDSPATTLSTGNLSANTVPALYVAACSASVTSTSAAPALSGMTNYEGTPDVDGQSFAGSIAIGTQTFFSTVSSTCDATTGNAAGGVADGLVAFTFKGGGGRGRSRVR